LFKAVDLWATKECERWGLVADGSVKRRILGENIVKGIRFLAMEEMEFVSVVLDCDIYIERSERFDEKFSRSLACTLGFSRQKRCWHLSVVLQI